MVVWRVYVKKEAHGVSLAQYAVRLFIILSTRERPLDPQTGTHRDLRK
jgi:hypothetical protein